MNASDVVGLTAHAAKDLLDRGEVSSYELTRAVLDRIHEVDDRVGAFVTVTADEALDQARQADRRIAGGDAAPLTGVPVQLKDNMCTRGTLTTCSSRMLQSYVPPYDATVVARLRQEGAVIVGKGNLDEFAMGSSTENSAFFPTRNPWDLDRVPGGSSGGPAAAVAAGECVFSLGSDTGGSIRQPAALCGVVGLKPTYGLVSRYGLVAFASSLDQIGPLTGDVTDSALVLNAIAGHDNRDSTSIDYEAPDYTRSLEAGVEGMRIGVPKEYFVEGLQPGVEEAVRTAIGVLEELRRQGRGDLATSHGARSGGLLHHRSLGGLGQPSPVRRREVRLLGSRGRRNVGCSRQDPSGRVRAGGQAADHARHIRAFCRVL